MIAMEPNPRHARPVGYPDQLPESYQRIRSQVEDRILERLLLEFLAAATPIHLPGGEGMRICDMLHEYEGLSVSGIVPTRSELILRHPELSAAIDRFFVPTANF
jgi:hypothetical protein